jgi:hypothetical protein
MPNKKNVLCFVLLFLSQFAYPNYKPRPGYYINLKGDTIHCNIEFNNWTISPGNVQVLENNNLKEFGPNDIRGFGVTENGDYLSSTVTYHTNPISGEDLPKNYSDNTETKSCFLKVLKKNVYSLYSLILPARRYLFISYPDKPIVELVYRAKRSNDSISEDDSYRNQMLALFANEGISQSYFEQISGLSYSASEVGAMIDILNEANTGVKTTKKSGNLQIDVFAGILQNAFPTSFDSHFTTANQFKSQISPTFGVNFMYPLPGKKFKIGLALGYNGYHCTINNSGSFQTVEGPSRHSTSDYNETITTENSFLVSNLYLMYLVNPLGSTRFYLKGGINYNFSLEYVRNAVNMQWSRTENGVQNGNMPFQNHYGDAGELIATNNYFISFKCAAGVNFGRSFLEVSYSPPVQIGTASEDIALSGNQTDFKLSTLGICLYFMLFH